MRGEIKGEDRKKEIGGSIEEGDYIREETV